MAFGSNNFGATSKSFDNELSKGFDNSRQTKKQIFDNLDNPFKFTPVDSTSRSRVRFYDRDALWTRWRRGYELYTITQSVFGSTATNRAKVGDYRFYCAFQQYPGIFTPARFFTFASNDEETAEHLVAIRDANALNFYDFGLPILSVRYLGDALTVPYSQTGTTITVLYQNHGFQLNDNVYLSFLSGTAVTATLPIVSKTNDSFTCETANAATAIGNVSVALSTDFSDSRWTEIRTKLRYLPTPTGSIVGERFTDRISERDPGLTAVYNRVGTTVTVTCSIKHGLFTGNSINLNVSSGIVSSGLYKVVVVSDKIFTITTIDSGISSGTAVVYRLIEQYNYGDYVGYTVKALDSVNNEVVFQRDDSYGVTTVDAVAKLGVPAQRGFAVTRFLTSEMRYQCNCSDFTRRSGYNFYNKNSKKRFPEVAITSTKPGTLLNKNNSTTDTRENIGVFSDLGYIATNNFYQLPDYNDEKNNCYTALMYYQMRWCKHLYAAFFSLEHDEGNQVIDLTGTYTQTDSFNITVRAANHGLAANTKIQINFTSGVAISGEFLIGQVIDNDVFVVIYPYSQTTAGYCEIQNVTEHSYVKAWLLEPSDHPTGDSSDTFYKNLAKENDRLKQSVKRLAQVKMGTNWLGTTSTFDFKNQPKSIANFQPTLLSSLITDDVIRDGQGNLSDSGLLLNNTQSLIAVMSKVVNLEPTLILNTKFGFLNEPLINYTTDYQYGLILCGTYLNGKPTEAAASVSTIDCGTYDPLTAQDVSIDCGVYGA